MVSQSRRAPLLGKDNARANDSRPPNVSGRPQSVSPKDELSVVDHEPGKFLFGIWQNVVVLAWAARADDAVIDRLKVALARIAKSHPIPRSVVSLIGPGLPMPTEEARAGIVKLMSAKGSQVGCLAVVIKGTGFQRSALHSVHTGMHVASAKLFEMAILDSVEALMEWLPPRHLKTGLAIDTKRLAVIVSEASERARAPGRLSRPPPSTAPIPSRS